MKDTNMTTVTGDVRKLGTSVGAALSCETRLRLLLHVAVRPTPVGKLAAILALLRDHGSRGAGRAAVGA